MPKQELIISQEDIQQRVQELGTRISTDFADKNLVMIGVLKGAFIFLADLSRAITIPHQIDFIRVASYGKSSTSSGKVQLSKDVEVDLIGKDVLLVEDIVDTGVTLAWLQKLFASKHAASVSICSLIDKKERRESDVVVDYTGFELERGFLIGYGLDYAEQYRHLPEIYSLFFS